MCDGLERRLDGQFGRRQMPGPSPLPHEPQAHPPHRSVSVLRQDDLGLAGSLGGVGVVVTRASTPTHNTVVFPNAWDPPRA